MNLDRIFHYTTTNPPDAEDFHKIGMLLSRELGSRIEGELEIIDEHIEPSSWVTNKIFIGNRNYGGTCYFGVVSYSLREGGPSITSVLLKFNDGQRVTDGRKAVLASNFTQSGWEEFAWEDDEFGEWECDHVSEIATIAD